MTKTITKCPDCGNDHLYQLGDGRYKCSSCQRKITPPGRRSRLSKETMDAIVYGFVSGSPASEVATDNSLNLKTVQLYYGRIRELLAKDREKHLARAYGSSRVSPDLFTSSGHGEQWRNAIFMGCLVDRETEIALLFTNDRADASARLASEDISGWLVAADEKAMENLQLDRMFCLPGRNAREKARTFWTHAKRRLSAYCGGFKKHFRLYLREMEYRNNMENTAAAREHIEELLDQTTLTSTGEKDA